MIHLQNNKVIGDVTTAAVGSTSTATLVVDTVGYDYASIEVIRGNNASTVFANVLKVGESDTTSSYSDVTALVGGGTGGFTVPGVAAANTANAAIFKFDVDCKSRKRYLQVSFTPGASVTTAIVARLGRGELNPATATDANLVGWVKG